MLSAGYPAFAALAVNGAISVRSRWAIGTSSLIAAAYAALICLRLVSLDATAKYKTVEDFRGMLAYVPPSSMVAVKIKDYLAFEWAAYYLRDRLMVPVVGRLVHLPARPLTSRQQNLLPRAQFLLTDMPDDNCWGAPVWSSTAYHLFAIMQPIANFDCGSLKPSAQ